MLQPTGVALARRKSLRSHIEMGDDMRIRSAFFAMALIGGLAACGTRTTWSHARFAANPEIENRERAIAIGDCRRLSVSSAPIPAFSKPSQSADEYEISGQSTLYGPRGVTTSSFRGTAVPSARQGNTFDAFMAGSAMGESSRARDDIFLGCMAGRGWTPR